MPDKYLDECIELHRMIQNYVHDHEWDSHEIMTFSIGSLVGTAAFLDCPDDGFDEICARMKSGLNEQREKYSKKDAEC